MVNIIRILFCALACFFSITAYASNDPVRDNWDKHLKNQYAYDQRTKRAASELLASVSMTPEKKANVKQMLERQGLLEDGSKVKIGASVTKPVDTAKVASQLASRFANAAKYAKDFGKASIPGFVGSAAFYGLMKGVDYVLDPENNSIVKNPSPDDPDPAMEQCTASNNNCSWSPTLYWDGSWAPYARFASAYAAAKNAQNISGRQGELTYSDGWWRINGNVFVGVLSSSNPNYSPTATAPTPEAHVATPSEIEEALKRALESNNPALATAISEAMKSAYTQDNSEGQPNTINPLVADAQNDMQRAVDGALDTPTSTGGTAERPSGYYKITDGDKTIEGYVTPSDTSGQTNTDTESTTVTDPITGNQTTTGTSTGSIQFPAFCDWAGIVCDWIGWTKEEPEEPKYDQPVLTEVQIPYAPFSIASFNAQCPVDMNLSLDLMGQNQNFVLPMSPFCDFFSSIKPFVIALASFFAVRLLGNASFNSGN